MTDVNPLEKATEDNLPTELEMLKQRAAAMGITHSNNIGVDALRKKVNAKMEGQQDNTDEEGKEVAVTETAAVTTPANPLTGTPANAPVLSLRQHLLNEATKLVRIRLTCMDPKKQDLTGEFFTVANEYIGTIRKYVPFGEGTDRGYHVPYCIYEMLKSREFLSITTRQDPRTGRDVTKTRYVKEFGIEVLPDLTPAQMAALAADQRATGRLDDEDEE